MERGQLEIRWIKHVQMGDAYIKAVEIDREMIKRGFYSPPSKNSHLTQKHPKKIRRADAETKHTNLISRVSSSSVCFSFSFF